MTTAEPSRLQSGIEGDAKLMETVKNILNDPSALREEFDRRQAQMQQPDDRSNRRRELRSEIKGLVKRLDRFLDLYGDGKLDRETLDSKVDEARKRRQAVE